MPPREDPVLRHSRREAWIIFGAWLAASLFCSTFYGLFGLIRPGHPLGREDIRPILGIPWWFALGVLAPWGVFALFSVLFAALGMRDDDLGEDEAARPGGPGEEWSDHE
jgi:hypothetical protein